MALFKRMLPAYLIALALALGVSLAVSEGCSQLSEALSVSGEPALPMIVLDPGHGGEDGGALSATGVKESVLNLEISLRLRDAFRFLGFSVQMTRETDISVHSPEAVTVSEKKVSDLKNRVRMVNESPNTLLLSIHQNMFSESRYRGAQVFYAGADRNTARRSRRRRSICSTRCAARRRWWSADSSPTRRRKGCWVRRIIKKSSPRPSRRD